VANPAALAVDMTNVYWVDSNDASGNTANGGVFKTPISGGNPASPTPLETGQGYPVNIGVSPYGLYWINGSNGTNPGGLWWLNNSGTLFQVSTMSQVVPSAMALNSTTVYWFDATSGSNPEALLSVTAGALATPNNLGNGGGCPIAMVLASSTLYWLDAGCFAGAGTLNKWTNPGTGTPVQLLPNSTSSSPLSGPYSHRIAVDTSGVYFFESNSSSIVRAPLTPASPTFLVPSATANGVAVDANYVYWTDPNQGAVLYAPLTGSGTPAKLASGQNTPYDVVLDANNVYWTNNANPGSVMRVAKP
jgi:hypothetical protein